MTTMLPTSGPAFIDQLTRLDGTRLRAYRDNLAFYRGQQWPGTARRERRLVFNYLRALIDKTTSYLMQGLSFVVDEDDASPAAQERARRAEKALRAVYDDNHLAQLDFDSEIDASVLGDGAFKVTRDADERRVRVSAPDVQGLFAWWVGDDISRVWRVASRYYLSSEEAALLYGGDVVRGPRLGSARNVVSLTGRKQHTVVEVWTGETFELWFDAALIESKPNPYGFIPFVIYPNLREPKKFWGVSDVTAVRESIIELNR